MAQMPRGEPRSVPDPAGEKYDEMIRYEQWKKQRADAAWANSNSLPPSLFPQFDSAPDMLNKASPAEPTYKIGRQWYREVDNGTANVRVPVDDPGVSPAEREEQRRAVARALFMQNSPLGGAAYGVATLANASPQARDAALVAGGAADAAMSFAPRVATPRGPASPAQRGQPAQPPLLRPNIRNRGVNPQGQALGIDVTLAEPMLGSGTRANPRIRPPGWSGNGTVHNEARGHLHARDLGGSGRKTQDLVTITQHPTNSPQMRNFEQDVASRMRAGEVVEYSVLPLYSDGILPPSTIVMTAHGSRGAPPAGRIISNPAGRRR
jgi:hypothetical protein